MRVSIDRAGRLVLPKAVREEAGIEPGMPLRICVRDGRIEIVPEFIQVRMAAERGFPVLRRAEAGPPLKEDEVRRTRRSLQRRRVPR